MKKVCLDTNILVWAVKGTSTIGQEPNIEKARTLMEYLDYKKISVVVPSLVLGELIGNVDDEDEREGIFDFISAHFEIAQHDILSAREYAKMRIELDKKNAKQYLSENNIPKCRMINDYNICAVAKSAGCDAIFSHNIKDFEKLIDSEIPIYTLDAVDAMRQELDSDRGRALNHPEMQVSLFPVPLEDDDDEDDVS